VRIVAPGATRSHAEVKRRTIARQAVYVPLKGLLAAREERFMTEHHLLDRGARSDAPCANPRDAPARARARSAHVLEKQRRVEALVHREQTPSEQKKPLVEQLVHRHT